MRRKRSPNTPIAAKISMVACLQAVIGPTTALIIAEVVRESRECASM
jgi:hypothetical protein